MRNRHRKISHTLSPQVQLGIDHIDISDSSILGEHLGDPTQSKTWKGPWLTLREPEKIVQEIKKINAAQYHQPFSTPFGSGPLADALGRQGSTLAAQRLLQGDMTSLPLQNLLPETICILEVLTRPYPSLSTETPPQ